MYSSRTVEHELQDYAKDHPGEITVGPIVSFEMARKNNNNQTNGDEMNEISLEDNNNQTNGDEYESVNMKISKSFPRNLVFLGTLLLLISLTMTVVGIYLLITGFGPCRTSEHHGKKVTRCEQNAGKIAGGSVLIALAAVCCVIFALYVRMRK